MKNRNFYLIRFRIFFIGLVLILQTFITLQTIKAFKIYEFVKLLGIVGYWLCCVVGALTLVLAILKKAKWREFLIYLFIISIISFTILYIVASNLRRTAHNNPNIDTVERIKN